MKPIIINAMIITTMTQMALVIVSDRLASFSVEAVTHDLLLNAQEASFNRVSD